MLTKRPWLRCVVMAQLVPVFIVAFVFGTICFISWVILEVVRNRQRLQASTELQGKLIDRLSAGDIGAFVTSENGGRLLRTLAEQPVGGDVAHARILRALQSGVVLLTVGISLFFYSGSRALPLEGEDVVDFIATIATALGVGQLLAAGASYRLSKRMGLLKPTDESSLAV
jgi:ABC-type multidrug transport system fused ATPase/permease subunit